MTSALPVEAEIIVVGGGSGGAAVAGRLAEGGREVLLLEAGPDPGPRGDPRWPPDLLDATRMGTSADWGLDSGDTYPDRVMRFERAKILGGCSTHNSAVQTWGHERDYDGWAELGGAGWTAARMRPLLEAASERQRVVDYSAAELTPYQGAWYEAGPGVGLPQLRTLNDLSETVGIAPESVNILDGVRFNSAFAYLDPARGRPNLTIVGDALVDRLILDSTTVTGVEVIHRGARARVAAGTVVLCGGSFCTPAVLLRSGVGPAADLRALGINVAVDLNGVGANLHDQPVVLMSWAGSAEIQQAMQVRDATGWSPDEQVMAKVASSWDPDCFDIHIFPYSPSHATPDHSHTWHAGASCLLPRSRGRVWITSPDPEVLPRVDHRFYSDPENHDIAVLREAIAMMRDLAAQPALAGRLGPEVAPGPAGLTDPGEIEAYLRAHLDSYWHPVGTCAMGPDPDAGAVLDCRGAVHGLQGCLVADCALMPCAPRATTAMPASVIGERIAAFMLGRD
jgi:choline dehydrogenase